MSTTQGEAPPSEAVMPRSFPPEFRRKVLDFVASGRKVAEVAQLLGISDQTIYVWRRQHLTDTGQLPGTNSSDLCELAAARKRIAELEAELATQLGTVRSLHQAWSGSKSCAPKPSSPRGPDNRALLPGPRLVVMQPGSSEALRHSRAGTG
ncbi:transposase [Streptomyces sp. NPDC005820]|uniref:transposase n=1 Tax=Streptomyces sp. NPDC005820 TaxID=3157069 RepID=UPI0033C60C05